MTSDFYRLSRLSMVNTIIIIGLMSLQHSLNNLSLKSKISTLEKNVSTLTENSPALIERNIIGGPEPEKFYQFGKNIAYVEIDGKPVGDYFLEMEERK